MSIQIIKHQLFVDGRGDLGGENAVISVNIGLIGIAVVAVHDMAQFVSDGENIV